jgi:hypothetical protein
MGKKIALPEALIRWELLKQPRVDWSKKSIDEKVLAYPVEEMENQFGAETKRNGSAQAICLIWHLTEELRQLGLRFVATFIRTASFHRANPG